MYNQVINSPDDSICKCVLLYDGQNSNVNGWSANIQNICESINRADSWKNMQPINLSYARQTLLKIYEDAWKKEVSDKSKLKVYCEIKEKIEPEALIAQLRAGILPIEIETSR